MCSLALQWYLHIYGNIESLIHLYFSACWKVEVMASNFWQKRYTAEEAAMIISDVNDIFNKPPDEPHPNYDVRYRVPHKEVTSLDLSTSDSDNHSTDDENKYDFDLKALQDPDYVVVSSGSDDDVKDERKAQKKNVKSKQLFKKEVEYEKEEEEEKEVEDVKEGEEEKGENSDDVIEAGNKNDDELSIEEDADEVITEGEARDEERYIAVRGSKSSKRRD